jgi:hypothetical protein
VRLGLEEVQDPLGTDPDYFTQVGTYVGILECNNNQTSEPLLATMEDEFSSLARRIAALQDQIPAYVLPLYQDLLDTAQMTALRAIQVWCSVVHTHSIYLLLFFFLKKEQQMTTLFFSLRFIVYIIMQAVIGQRAVNGANNNCILQRLHCRLPFQ